MLYQISLRSRIYLLLGGLMLITLMGGLVTMWYTYKMEGLLTVLITEDLAAFQTAAALETALVNQKGFVTYYLLDNDPDWLRQLGEYRQIFKQRLREARSSVETEDQQNAIDLIESEYENYITLKDRVIDHYKAGEREAGAILHKKVRSHFFNIINLCEGYKKIHTTKIMRANETSQARAKKLRAIAIAAMMVGFFMVVLLTFVLAHQILGPIRSLTAEADREKGSDDSENEIKALGRSVRGLIKDVDHTQSELQKSQEHLVHAERMALVGKLAAGMAHSIRNPFTSVKMRLFSLSRSG